VPNAPYDRDAVFLFAGTKIFGRSKVQLHLKSTFVPSYFRTFESTKVRKYFCTKYFCTKYESTKVLSRVQLLSYESTTITFESITFVLSYFRTSVRKIQGLSVFWSESQKNVRRYFRALPRVVASSIELTLRHDVVHNADDVPTKFRDFKRSGRWFSDPSATFLKPPVKHSPQRSTSLL
jgi:hypothetical protein